MTKKAIILSNVGTPDKPEVNAVRRYLTQFLNDRRVIDIPWLLRKILVNLIIVPFRAPKSTKLYEMLWTEKGSPLLFHTESLAKKLEKKLGKGNSVFVAMRYGNPGIKGLLSKLAKEEYDEIIVAPLYPQFALSTTETTVEYFKKWFLRKKVNGTLRFIGQFYDHPSFLKAYSSTAKEYDLKTFDHVVFSYHGLPMRQVQKIHPEVPCKGCTCESALPNHGTNCYKATCYETSRLLAKKLGLDDKDYTVSFQSRLSNNWLEPFSDKVLNEKAQTGTKRILVFTPSFVTDCLETIVEIGIEYTELFKENGGEELVMAESLNDNDEWVEALAEIVS